ncbi:hypothetical protein BDZ97DRAFT_1722449 [Flammula alnicola]|nr:hypothetical protein BDZ97DRAFT_1722449 [Flammula alnicola]
MNHTGTSELTTDSVSASSRYLDYFRKHQESVQAHLTGRLDSSRPLLPGFTPPASYWTSVEKDIFFHGLTIYSRLRPDLIAEHIKTKNTFDVCLYLDSLQTAALRDNVSQLTIRNMSELAMEVSERWVKHEETMAETLNVLASCSWSAGNAENEGAPCSCLHGKGDGMSPVQHDVTTFARKEIEEYLTHLDSTSLIVLENIIREAEPKPERLELKVHGLATGPDLQTAAVSNYDRVDALPSDAQNGGLLSSQNNIQSMGSELPMTMSDGKESTLFSEPRIQNMVEENFEEPSSSEKELQRRLKKRLYMRRKRAEQAGKAVIPDLNKLRPGRQKTTRKPSKPRPKTYKPKRMSEGYFEPKSLSPQPETAASQPNSLDMNHEDVESICEPRTQGGTTKPYRIKKVLQENGVDAEMLSHMDLDFFHLSTLARLMRLYNPVSNSMGPLELVSISADTVQLLVSITTEFVSEIVRRAVITKEQEIRLKGNMKVWKYDKDEITAENVAECLNSMELGHLDKEKYFAHLLDQEGNEYDQVRSPVPSAYNETTDEEDRHESVIEQHLKNHNIPDSKDHSLRTPHFTLPRSMLWCSLPSHRNLFSMDNVLSDEINADKLRDELDQDEQLNAEDEARSREYEESLWSMEG